MRLNWLVFGCICIAFGSIGCVDRGAQAQAKRTEKMSTDQVRPVVAKPVETVTLTDSLEISGAIATSEDTSISAKIGGRLVAVYVKDGDSVSAGQVIAQQETSDALKRVQQAQAQVSGARAALQQAESNAALGPQKSAAAVKSAEAQLVQAKAALAKLRQGARTEERAQAKASAEAAKTNLETARKSLERTRELYAGGAVSKQALEAAENAYSAALSQYEQALQSWNMMQAGARAEDITGAEQAVSIAEEGVRTARANQRLDVVLKQQVDGARANLQAMLSGLAIAQQGLSDAQIRAPFSGRISGRPVQPGTYVGPGSAVARLIGGGGVYFEGEVPEGKISLLRPQQLVEVRIDALGDQKILGSIATIDPLGSNVGRLFRVRIQIEGAVNGLRPGMFATGSVVLRTMPNAKVVPQSAVLKDDRGSYVFVLDGTKVRKRSVRTGITNNGKIEVEGLLPEDLVITQGQNSLTDGTTVRVETDKPTSGEPGSEKAAVGG